MNVAEGLLRKLLAGVYVQLDDDNPDFAPVLIVDRHVGLTGEEVDWVNAFFDSNPEPQE